MAGDYAEELRLTNIRDYTYCSPQICNWRSNFIPETEKQKEKRIAKERMFSSWKLYNQVTDKIIEIKQICKPRHNRRHL